jgi:protein tyrosine phosphatase
MAYISTQGPLDETVEDFWLMIWQQCVLSIAMTTKVVEQRKLKCSQYWPLEEGQVLEIPNLFTIKNTNVEELGDYRITKLTMTHIPVSILKWLFLDILIEIKKKFLKYRKRNKKSIFLRNDFRII